MHYSPEAVVELERGRQEVLGELEDLWLPLARDLVRSLTNERAQEYLVHGICRRLMTIGRCIGPRRMPIKYTALSCINEGKRVRVLSGEPMARVQTAVYFDEPHPPVYSLGERLLGILQSRVRGAGLAMSAGPNLLGKAIGLATGF
jgi:hypothetical protein